MDPDGLEPVVMHEKANGLPETNMETQKGAYKDHRPLKGGLC